MELWPVHFTEEWLPKRAVAYFREKDTKALPALEQLLALPAPLRYTLPPADGSTPKKPVVAKKTLVGKSEATSEPLPPRPPFQFPSK